MTKKLSDGDILAILAFLGRVVPRGQEEADRLHALIGLLQNSLTKPSRRA